MSHPDHFIQAGLATPNASPVDSPVEEPSHLFGEGSDLERLVPQNLSNNKRAVIERLIVLYKLDSHRF